MRASNPSGPALTSRLKMMDQQPNFFCGCANGSLEHE